MTHHKYQQTIIPQQKTGQQHNTLTTLHMPFSVISYPVSKRMIYLFPFLLIKCRHLLTDTQKAVERQIELFWLWYCTWGILHFQHSCLIHTNTHQKTVSPSSLFPGETWVTKSDCTKLHGRWVRQYYKKVVFFFLLLSRNIIRNGHLNKHICQRSTAIPDLWLLSRFILKLF